MDSLACKTANFFPFFMLAQRRSQGRVPDPPSRAKEPPPPIFNSDFIPT